MYLLKFNFKQSISSLWLKKKIVRINLKSCFVLVLLQDHQ